MTYREIDSPIKEIKKIADERAKDKRLLQLMVVTGIDTEDKQTGLISDYRCSVKSMVTKLQYDNVPIIGTGLGHFKGILKYPEVDDMVLCAFLDGTPSPFILGTVFDYFSQGTQDRVPQIKRNELFMTNKTFGSIVYLTEDNEIILKSSDPETGDFKDSLGLARAQIKLTPGKGLIPGAITISTDGLRTDLVGLAWTVGVVGAATITFGGALAFWQPTTGAGIFIDPLGNVTIKGKTVNYVKV